MHRSGNWQQRRTAYQTGLLVMAQGIFLSQNGVRPKRVFRIVMFIDDRQRWLPLLVLIGWQS